jgi:hypothetical protein
MPKESQWDARPHPAPMASQARHESVAQIGTCASRIVVPLEREKESQALNKFIAVVPASASAQLEDSTGSLDYTRGPTAS